MTASDRSPASDRQSAPRVAVVGSLNMDIVVSMDRLPHIGETIAGRDVVYIPGGKGANQAFGLARLGAHAAMIGRLGSDVFGERIRRHMEEAGVDMGAVEPADGMPTGTAHISHTPEDNCIVVVAGANGACDAAYVRRRAEVIRRAAVTIAQLEIPIPAVLEAFRTAKEAGGITVLNPAPAAQLPDELLRLTDYITPNETEWSQLSGDNPGDDEALAASIRRWEAKYECRVVVTLGARGCAYVEAGGLVVVPAPKVSVVDTTGAGDAFNAAFAHALALGRPLVDCCSFAVRAASRSVMTFGAQAGMPRLSDLEPDTP